MIKRRSFFAIVLLVASPLALATDIEGVQPAALDQPRVHMHLRRDPHGQPLSAKAMGESTINVQAFLDTGASGILLSKTTADGLGVKRETAGKDDVTFTDVGVGGGDRFNVSDPLYVYLAPFGKNGEPQSADLYPISLGPVRAQIGASAGLLDMLTGGLDVVGMPAIKGHVIVVDPKPVDHFDDTMRAGLFDARDKAKMPKCDRHVKLSFASFQRFTTLEPATAQWPTLADNPFIGPNPTLANAPPVPAVTVTHNGKQSTGSWLLDTGAAASMISKKQAEKLGITYVEGTEGTGSPKLNGVPDDRQFTFTVGGVGGSKKSAGFFIDSLALPTQEKDPIVYRGAPVLVSDITVEDPKTHEKITLDGVFGMNFLVATANVQESGLMPDINHMTAGAYEWIVIDAPAATLGLKLKREFEKPGDRIEIKPSSPRAAPKR